MKTRKRLRPLQLEVAARKGQRPAAAAWLRWREEAPGCAPQALRPRACDGGELLQAGGKLETTS